MGDTVQFFEIWTAIGIAEVLKSYPMANALLVLMLIRMALKHNTGGVIKNNMKFSTETKNARKGFDSKGRRFAEGFSLQTVSKYIRKRVVPKGSFEVDIVNCYPAILMGLARGKVRTTTLASYVNNRASCYAEVTADLRVKHDVAKEVILVIISGKSWRWYLARQRNVNPKEIPNCKFLDDLQTEMLNIRRILKASEEYRKIVTELKDVDKARVETLAFSLLLERNERKILDTLIESSYTHFEFTVSTLLHDGFVVANARVEEGTIKNGSKEFEVAFVERVLSSRCTEEYGHDITIKVCPLF